MVRLEEAKMRVSHEKKEKECDLDISRAQCVFQVMRTSTLLPQVLRSSRRQLVLPTFLLLR